jgi:hypothetical protein
MPPWPAAHGYGAFANDGGLTPREREFLLSWIDGGAPEGEGAPPPFVDHSGHWMLGPPDHVYVAGPEQGPGDSASGSAATVVTRFLVETHERQAMSVRAFDVAMPDRSAARSAFLSVLDTGQYLGGWTPWHSAVELPPGTAYRLPPGARVAIDVMHAVSTRVVQPPQLAIYLAPAATTRIDPFVLAGEGADGSVVRMSERIWTTHTMVAFRVGMSAGAGSIELRVRRPDGMIEPLLWIRQYRPDWQVPYVLREPLELPAGSTLEATARFDDASPRPMRASVDLVAAESAAAPRPVPPATPAHGH